MPVKLIEIIRINRAVRMVVSPFRLVAEVRFLCSSIVLIGRERSQKVWFGQDQKRGWISKMVIIFIDQKRVGEIWNIEVVAGSKDEKMSIIIKICD